MVPDIHAQFHNESFIMRRAIWRHVFGHTDSHTHIHTIKPPTAGVQLVGHTSNIIFTWIFNCYMAILVNYRRAIASNKPNTLTISVKRFERSNGLDTALYKNYLYLYMIARILFHIVIYSIHFRSKHLACLFGALR